MRNEAVTSNACDTFHIVYFKIVKIRLFVSVHVRISEFGTWVPRWITLHFLPGHSRTHMCFMTYDVIMTS